MDIEIAERIVRGILETNETFDSHAFIRAFMKEEPQKYGEMLTKCKDVRSLHAKIGNFLLYKASDLGIEVMDNKTISRTVFDNEMPNAEWRAVTKKD